MTPRIANLSDDRAKALAVMEDMLKGLRSFRVGLFARDGKPVRIALSDPIGEDSQPPFTRTMVTRWRDFCNVEAVSAFGFASFTQADDRALDILYVCQQVMRHFDSALIPAPVRGLPTILLCDGVPGNGRAYSLVAQLDCYGYTERGINPGRTN